MWYREFKENVAIDEEVNDYALSKIEVMSHPSETEDENQL